MKRKLFSIVLSFVMLVAFMPAMTFTAFADAEVTYTKIEKLADLVSGQKYLITYKSSSSGMYYGMTDVAAEFMGGQGGTTKYTGLGAVELAAGSAEAAKSDNISKCAVFTYTKDGDSNVFKTADNKYLTLGSHLLSLGDTEASLSFDGKKVKSEGNYIYCNSSAKAFSGSSSGSSVTLFEVAESEGGGEDEEEIKTDFNVKPDASNPPEVSESLSIGGKLTVGIENGGGSEYEFSISMNKDGVAGVSESNIKIASGKTGTFEIEGLKDGTVTISISNGNTYSERKATIVLTVGTGVEPAESRDYVKADEFEIGETYLIVNAGSGSAKALKNTKNGSFGICDVTISGEEITSSEFSSAEWEAVSAGVDGHPEYIGLKNNGTVLKITVSNNSPKITTSGTGYNNGNFSYTEGEHISYPYGSTPYYIGSDNDTFKAAASEEGLGKVYIFKKDDGSDEPPVGPSDNTVVGFSSDVHNQSGNKSADRLDNWINNVAEKCGKLDDMGFTGDMGPASGTYWTYAQTAMDKVKNNSNVDENGFYICGNHEYNPGSYTHNLNDTTKLYSDAGAYDIDEDGYILYSMGARQWDEIYSDADINSMKAFLNGSSVKNSKDPIFIMGHFPLHCYNNYTGESSTVHDGRAAVGSAAIIEALNEAADENGQTIVFLWGHNHSSSSDHYDKVYTDKINNTDIDFVYASAGAMSDSEYGRSGDVKGKGLIAEIGDKSMSLKYYNAAGTEVGTGATVSLDREPAEKHTITAAAGEHGSISPSGAVEVSDGRDKTFTFTPDGGYEVGKVTVDGEEVTVTGNTYTVRNVKKDTTINVTFSKTNDVLLGTVTQVPKAGGKYAVVSGGYALYNDNGTMSKVPVTGSSGDYYISDSKKDGASWLFSAAEGTDKSGDFEVSNDGYLFTRVSDASGNDQAAEITKNKETSETSGLPYYQWSYDGGHFSQVGGQNKEDRFYAYYDETNGAFYTSTSEKDIVLVEVEAGTDPSEDVHVESVSLDKTSAEIAVGGTLTLTATILPENADNKAVTWTSSKEDVATVTAEGVVTGAAEGTADITVTTEDGNKTATCTVTVKPAGEVVHVTGVSLDKKTAEVKENETVTLTADVQPADAADREVTWTSDDTSVATVSDGVVTGVKAGTAVITVKTVDGEFTDTCQVTVTENIAVTGIAFDKVSVSLSVGEIAHITASVFPEDATNKEVVWTSGAPDVVSVSDGYITGLAEGVTLISAKTVDGEFTAVCAVTVKSVSPVPDPEEQLIKEKEKAYEFFAEKIRYLELSYAEAEQITVNKKIIQYSNMIKDAESTDAVKTLIDEFNDAVTDIPTRKDYDEVGKIGLKLKSVTAGKSKASVKWTPKKTLFSGYRIAYKIKGKSWKYKYVDDKSKSSVTIKSLKKGKTYTFKIRGYKMFGEKKVYGKNNAGISKKIK